MVKPKQQQIDEKPRMIKVLPISAIPEPFWDGSLDHFFVDGLPRLRFLVPERSQAWMELKEMERTGEIKAAFPQIARGAGGPRLYSKEILHGMMYSFDEVGHFRTRIESWLWRPSRPHLTSTPAVNQSPTSMPKANRCRKTFWRRQHEK